MPNFSSVSRKRLESCHPLLQKLFNEIIQHVDCTVVDGYRNKEDQENAFKEHASKKHFPFSRHNSIPSEAVDVAPYDTKNRRINWKNTREFIDFAQIVLATARELGIDITWGGDWNQNGDWKDEDFLDLIHFELSK